MRMRARMGRGQSRPYGAFEEDIFARGMNHPAGPGYVPVARSCRLQGGWGRLLENSEFRSNQSAVARGANDRERELIFRVAGGDRDAFRDLYVHYHRRLARFLTRLTRRQEDAEEIINDTLWIVWQRAAEFRDASQVSTWIMGIAYRRALNVIRRAATHE